MSNEHERRSGAGESVEATLDDTTGSATRRQWMRHYLRSTVRERIEALDDLAEAGAEVLSRDRERNESFGGSAP